MRKNSCLPWDLKLTSVDSARSVHWFRNIWAAPFSPKIHQCASAVIFVRADMLDVLHSIRCISCAWAHTPPPCPSSTSGALDSIRGFKDGETGFDHSWRRKRAVIESGCHWQLLPGSAESSRWTLAVDERPKEGLLILTFNESSLRGDVLIPVSAKLWLRVPLHALSADQMSFRLNMGHENGKTALKDHFSPFCTWTVLYVLIFNDQLKRKTLWNILKWSKGP